ncbi:MAG TPA: alginate lyase family protein [Bacteroidota bacterium]|nr:alginate lyase family protein [Bacteroidota bacterium]
MNIFRFSILALRKAGPLRFISIAATKIYRWIVRDRDLRTIRDAKTAAILSNGFFGILPLDRTTHVRFKKKFPPAAKSLLARAQKIRTHKFDLLGCSLKFGKTIYWHNDPATGKEWLRKNYSEIALHYDGSPVDAKPVWELNRHQHFVTLAQAWFISKNRTYFDELMSEWLDWIDENPCGVGINWASPLEIGVRLISWTLAFQFIEDQFSLQQKEQIAKSVWQQCAFLSSHLSTDKIIRTNHLIGECSGLLIAATSFAFPESERWGNRAQKILEEEILSQVYKDGFGKEQSSSYHRFVVDFFLLAYLRMWKTAFPFSDTFVSRLKKMIECLEILRTPDDGLPPFGDCDNGRGFMLAPSLDFWDASGLIAVAAGIFKDYIPVDTPKPNEESFWLLSKEEWDELSATNYREREELHSIRPESGLVVLRSGRSPKDDYCFFRAGEFGMGGEEFSSHSHNDLFSPIIFLNGLLIFTDTGTSIYLGNDPERDYLRSTAAHNATSADSWNLFKAKRWFGWKKIMNGSIAKAQGHDKDMTVECEYEQGDVPYKRKFSFNDSSSEFRIEDIFTENTRNVHSYFHLDTGLTARAKRNTVEILKRAKPVARLTFPDTLTLKIEHGWISKAYGMKDEAEILHFSWDAVAHTPVQFILLPFRQNPK